MEIDKKSSKQHRGSKVWSMLVSMFMCIYIWYTKTGHDLKAKRSGGGETSKARKRVVCFEIRFHGEIEFMKIINWHVEQVQVGLLKTEREKSITK